MPRQLQLEAWLVPRPAFQLPSVTNFLCSVRKLPRRRAYVQAAWPCNIGPIRRCPRLTSVNFKRDDTVARDCYCIYLSGNSDLVLPRKKKRKEGERRTRRETSTGSSLTVFLKANLLTVFTRININQNSCQPYKSKNNQILVTTMS